MEFYAQGLTDIGPSRTKNEDSILLRDDVLIYGVFDGMGGHKGGAVASTFVMEEFLKLDKDFIDNDDIAKTLLISDEKLFHYGRNHLEFEGMGTTAIVAYIKEKENKFLCSLFNIGDSRCYLFRKGILIPLSLDQSWYNERVRLGYHPTLEDQHANKNAIAKCIGGGDLSSIARLYLDLEDGDILMLCSDGLHGYMDHMLISQIFRDEIRKNNFEIKASISNIPNILIKDIYNNKGKDNISIILLGCGNYTSSWESLEHQIIIVQNTGMMNGPIPWEKGFEILENAHNIEYICSSTGFSCYIFDGMMMARLLDSIGVMRSQKIENMMSHHHPHGMFQFVDKTLEVETTKEFDSEKPSELTPPLSETSLDNELDTISNDMKNKKIIKKSIFLAFIFILFLIIFISFFI